MHEIANQSTVNQLAPPPQMAAGNPPPDGTSAAHRPELAILHQAALAFNSSLDLNEVLHSVLEELREALRADGWGVWLVQPGSQDIICQQAEGPGRHLIEGRRMAIDEGIIGLTVRSGKSIYVGNTADDPRYSDRVASEANVLHGSLLCAPLLLRQPNADEAIDASTLSAMGAVVVISEAADAFSDSELALLEALAAAAATAIANAQLYRRANQEIQERLRVERALRHSESLYRTMIEASPDAVFVTDLRNVIKMCNLRTLELCGYERRADLLGRSFLMLFAPESRAEVLAVHNRILEGHAVPSREFVLLRQDDTSLDAEYVASLIAGESGSSLSVVGFARDITERKEAENTIRRRNHELRILNSIATHLSQAGDLDGILEAALDETLKVLHVDTGWVSLFGDSARSATSQTDTEVLVHRGKSLHARLEGEALILHQGIEERLRRTGRAFLVNATEPPPGWASDDALCQVAAVPLVSQGSVHGVLAVMGLEDHSPRTIRFQQLQLMTAIGHQVAIAIENARLTGEVAEIAMLRELNQMRSELIANFSHDLRTPLGLIKMACSTLQRDDVVLGEEIVEDVLEDIQSQTDRLSRLVEGILDLGHIESEHYSLHRIEADVGVLAQQVLGEFQRDLAEHHLALDLGDGPLTALVDPDKLDQVLWNLLDNAVKYSPGGGEIVTKIRQHAHELILSITDSGIGVPPDQRELVFERFYRGSSPLVAHVGGVGLGLPTCRGIVQAHGGTIWIEDGRRQGTDVGATIVFTLPVAPYAEGQA